MSDLSIVRTNDGSPTLFSSRFGAYYHSLNGAVTESNHIFIDAGLRYVAERTKSISILEVGFGTGLNALLTAMVARNLNIDFYYHGIELYPPPNDLLSELNLNEIFKDDESADLWSLIANSTWNNEIQLASNFRIHKEIADFTGWVSRKNYSLVYFDAFAPDDQPEMWSQEQLMKINKALNANGVLVTYSAKGMVKSNLRFAGFKVERLSGPPGKRHMIRAIKLA